jgi:hypothetical protein
LGHLLETRKNKDRIIREGSIGVRRKPVQHSVGNSHFAKASLLLAQLRQAGLTRIPATE